MSEGPKNDWFSPQTVLGVLGMAGAVITAYIALDSRLTRVEAKTEYGDARLGRIEQKLDELIQRGGVR